MKNILIVEDDKTLAKTLLNSLRSFHTTTRAVHTADQAYTVVQRRRFDLVVLDRMLGKEDMLDEANTIRDFLPHVKILFLTRKSEAIERIRGLEAGADDYLCKPFSLAELRLRVRILLNRPVTKEGKRGIPLGEIVFFPEQGIVQTPEKRVFLRKREAEVISCLSQRPGVLVNREAMNSYLWPGTYQPHPDTLDVYVRRLRQKLGKYRSVVQTQRGFGYRLAVERET